MLLEIACIKFQYIDKDLFGFLWDTCKDSTQVTASFCAHAVLEIFSSSKTNSVNDRVFCLNHFYMAKKKYNRRNSCKPGLSLRRACKGSSKYEIPLTISIMKIFTRSLFSYYCCFLCFFKEVEKFSPLAEFALKVHEPQEKSAKNTQE